MRGLRGTLGVPSGAFNKLVTSGIGIKPEADAAVVAENVARFAPPGQGGAIFGGVPGALYDFLFTMAADPLMLASAPENALHRVARGIAREGIETGAHIATGGADVTKAVEGMRKGPQTSFMDMLRGKYIPDDFAERVAAPEMMRRDIELAATHAGVPLKTTEGLGVREALGLGSFDPTNPIPAMGPVGGPIPPSVKALRETLDAVKAEHPDYVAAKARYMKQPYESAEQLISRGIRQSRFGEALGFRQDLLSDVGMVGIAEKTQQRLLAPLWDESLPLTDRLSAYALREAQTLKGITKGAPNLRFAGVKTPLPSPIPVMAGAMGRAFGNWVDIGERGRAPLAGQTVTSPGTGHGYAYGRKWVDAAGNSVDWSTTAPAAYGGGDAAALFNDVTGVPVRNAFEAEQALAASQTGPRGMARGFNKAYGRPGAAKKGAGQVPQVGGILTAGSRSPGATSGMKNLFDNWLTRYLKSFAQADRPAQFDKVRAVYQYLYDLKIANPDLKMSFDMKAMKETLDHMDVLSGASKAADPAMLAKHTARAEEFWQALLPLDQGLKPVQQFRNELMTRIQRIVTRSERTLDEPVSAIDAEVKAVPKGTSVAPDEVVKALDTATQRTNTFFDNPEAQQEIYATLGALNEWLQSMVPPQIANENYNEIFRAGDLAGRRAAESARQEWLLETLLGSPELKKPTSGLELTAQLIRGQKRNPVRKAINGMMASRKIVKPGEIDLTSITPAEVTLQRTAFEKAITEAEAAGRMDAPSAAELRAFMDDLEPNPEAWGAWVRVMKDAADFQGTEMAIASILKQVFEPLKTMFQQADAMGRKLSMKTMGDLQRQLSSEQVLYVPHGPGKWKIVQNILEKADETQRQIMRFAGIPEALGRVVRENDDAMLYADRKAEGWSKEFRRMEVEKAYRTIVPQAAGIPLPRRTLMSLNEGFMKKAGNQGWELFQHEDPQVVADVQKIAQDRIAEGDAALLEVFGDPKIAEDWFQEMRRRADKHSGEMFNLEREAGLVDVRRADYIPHLLLGSFTDQDKFWKWAAGKDVMETHSGLRPIVSETFAPGLTRDRMTMAEVEYALQKFKEQSKTSQPINLRPAYHLSGAMAYRKLQHLRALATRKFVVELQSALPGHLLPLGLAPSKAMAAGFEKADFRNLGDLVPSLRDWWAQPQIYQFLKSRVAKNGLMLDFEGGTFAPYRFMREFMRMYKWFNTTFDIYHTKNILGLAFVSDTDLSRAWGILKRAWKNRGEGVGSLKEQALSPIEAIVEGLEMDPMYQFGLRHGLAPFRGHEYQVPLVDRIMAEEAPVVGFGGKASAALTDIRLRGGPGSKITFDLLDQAVKQAKFEELLENGVAAHHAADLANYHLIDYSLRWMHPDMRNTAYAIFPFFAWKIGNWALHPAQFLQRPGRYMLFNHLREAATGYFTGNLDGSYHDALSEMVAGGMIIPMQDPETGNQMVLDWAMPWDSIFAPFRRLSQESPAEWPQEFMRYFAGNVWDIPYKWFVQSDNQRRYEITEDMARKGWANWAKETFVGTPDKEGLLSALSWGVQPWKDVGGLMTDPSKWQNWDFYTTKFFVDLFANTTQMTPSVTTGKMRRAPISP